jgi:hypothetical protein
LTGVNFDDLIYDILTSGSCEDGLRSLSGSEEKKVLAEENFSSCYEDDG